MTCIGQNIGVKRKDRLGRSPDLDDLAAVLGVASCSIKIPAAALDAEARADRCSAILDGPRLHAMIDAVVDSQLTLLALGERPEVPAERRYDVDSSLVVHLRKRMG